METNYYDNVPQWLVSLKAELSANGYNGVYEEAKMISEYYEKDLTGIEAAHEFIESLFWFHSPESSQDIISYGNYKGQRRFKITYKVDTYYCFYKQGRKYIEIGSKESLSDSISLCKTYIFENRIIH